VKSGEFFRNAQRSGVWPKAEAVHRSTFTKARSKVDWQIFRDLLKEALVVAHDVWPESDEYLWHEMSVYAVDGSKYTLPGSKEIREEFDPKSGLQNSGKGHYPQCLVTTVYDVFRRLPIARSIVAVDSSEREEFMDLLPAVPFKSVLLFDRGYPSYGLILHLLEAFKGYFIFRCPAQCTFPAVEAFVKSGKAEDVIWIEPSGKFLDKLSVQQRGNTSAVKIRVIKLVSPDGTVSCLLTNLYNKKFSKKEIINLYFRRWEIEVAYRNEKVTMAVEEFHGKTCNSIRQELFAAAIISVISRTLMMIASLECEIKPQFKNAIATLAADAPVLAADDPEKAIEIFRHILIAIRRVKYYLPKKPRPSQPRVNKGNINKWSQSKTKKVMANA
jgi:hypothetical protein